MGSRRSGISNVLVCDRDGEALAGAVVSRRSDLTCRVRAPEAIGAVDRHWADVLLGFGVGIDLGDSSIRWVHSTGAGVDALLEAGRWPDDVLLTRSPGTLGARIGEYCLAHALAETQRLSRLHDDQAARRWAPTAPTTLAGGTVVIVGTGTVGAAVATSFGALGCRTIGISRSGSPHVAFDETRTTPALERVVGEADWLVVTAPLTATTRGLIGRRVLCACRSVYLINVARGALVDTPALLEALRSGAVAGATLDVFEQEPLQEDSPLWDTPGVVVTPHIAGVTLVEEAADAFLEALTGLEAGQSPPWRVDPIRGY